jgi:hypothetical protein
LTTSDKTPEREVAEADASALVLRFDQYLRAELWTGCDFGCRYCLPVARRWAKRVGQLPDAEGLCEKEVQPRRCDPLNLSELDSVPGSWRGGIFPPVLLSFMCDPYPKEEETAGVTREAIAMLHSYRIGVRILTKSGTRAVRDFQPAPGEESDDEDCPNLGSHPDDAFGATMSFLDEADSRKWEPRAAIPAERMEGLREAHRRGIPTVLNLSPVIDPEQSLEIVRLTHDFVDLYNPGPLLEMKSTAPPFDWDDFAVRAFELCLSYGKPCLVDLPDDSCEDDSAPALGELFVPGTPLGLFDEMMCEPIWRGICQVHRPAWTIAAGGRQHAHEMAMQMQAQMCCGMGRALGELRERAAAPAARGARRALSAVYKG